jgi:cation diffusion facilitator CzcD-associated flavoprotein CzcO
MHAKPEQAHVLVIGAGPAGIATAYALQQAGIPYLVIDRADVIASTWHDLYPSLTLNTTRFFSHMVGARFPLRYGIFPTARQYYDYLLAYVAKQRLNIRLGVAVRRVSRDPQEDGRHWRVETSAGVWHFPSVVCATGVFGRPVMPDIDGLAGYGGRVMHAHDYKHPHQVQGDEVLVVGTGPSGIDIAIASAETARRVYLGVRSGITLVRRYPLGLPKHAWMMLGEHLPNAWCEALMRLTTRHYPEAERYGIAPPKGKKTLTAYQGRELLDAVAAGKVTLVPAPVAFSERGATLADGRTLCPDTVIMATGYAPVLHDYLDVPMQFSPTFFEPSSPCDWAIGANGQRGFPMLDRSAHPNGREIVGQSGLYVVGVHYKGKGAMYNFNVEAAILVQQVKARLL